MFQITLFLWQHLAFIFSFPSQQRQLSAHLLTFHIANIEKAGSVLCLVIKIFEYNKAGRYETILIHILVRSDMAEKYFELSPQNIQEYDKGRCLMYFCLIAF